MIFVYIVQEADLEQSRLQLQEVQQERDTLIQQVRGRAGTEWSVFSPKTATTVQILTVSALQCKQSYISESHLLKSRYVVSKYLYLQGRK